jgi:hypothetical protein
MRKGLLITFILITNSLFGQNIYTALHLNRTEDVRTNKTILEISETNTFFNSSGPETKKVKKTLNKSFLVELEERFDNQGKLTDRLTRKFDPTGQKIISRKFERWNNKQAYSLKTSFYEYDESGYLIKMTDQNANGNIIQQAILTNNKKGHPVKLELYDGNGYLYGIEVATYDYSINKAMTEVKDQKGKTLSSDSITIVFSNAHEFPTQDDVFNQYGDRISSKKYVYERKYDEFENWITVTIYRMEKGKKKKNRKFKRKIKYAE